MRCPNCGLVNPTTAVRCDCGYDFASRTLKAAVPGAAQPGPAQAPPFALEIAAVLLLMINSCQTGILHFDQPFTGAELAAVVFAPALVAIVVAAAASMFRSGRSRRVRARAVAVAMLTVFLWNTVTCLLHPKREGSVGSDSVRPRCLTNGVG